MTPDDDTGIPARMPLTESLTDEARAEIQEAEQAETRSPMRSLEGEGGQPVGADWLVERPPPIEWFLQAPGERGPVGVMPVGTVGMLNAPGGSGKTFALTQLAVATATGSPWFGRDGWEVARPGRVFLGMGEEDRDMVRRRLHKALDHLAQSTGADFDTLARKAGENIVVPPFRGMGIALMGREDPSQWAAELASWLEANGPWSLIILDPLSRWGGPDVETDNHAATRAVELLESLTLTDDKPVVMVAHHTRKPSKDGGGLDQHSARGASALVDGARWVAVLERNEDADRRCLKVVKVSHAKRPDPLALLTEQDTAKGGCFNVASADEVKARHVEGSEWAGLPKETASTKADAKKAAEAGRGEYDV